VAVGGFFREDFPKKKTTIYKKRQKSKIQPKKNTRDLGRAVRNLGKNNFLEEEHNVVDVAVGGFFSEDFPKKESKGVHVGFWTEGS
jgi:hypothetical protein